MSNDLSASDHAQILETATDRFWSRGVLGIKAVLGIHIIFLMTFIALDVKTLWLTNIGSVVIHFYCLQLLKAKRYRLTSILLISEIVAHAVIATVVLGWHTGFYYYLLCIIPVALFNYTIAPFWRWVTCAITCTCLLIGKVTDLFFAIKPLFMLSPRITELFSLFNLSSAIVMLVYVSALAASISITMQADLFTLANKDSLTNLYTRGRLHSEAQRLYRSPQTFKPISLIMLDVDHFKSINDTFGHDVGDTVLQRVSSVIAASVRGTDVASRWGGEEFLILMRNTDLKNADKIAERILNEIRAIRLEVEGGTIMVTATLATCVIGESECLKDAIKRTDKALYQGKQQGRNRIMRAAQAVAA
ncbi:diguanylate cyclase [Pseudomonas sp.]|uniref:GGDEF domain-containing protein n=1 Tax=Pseudomonas sp. TaxID=306 RepID=UPI0028A234D6|nr:diguanylate cyclase [Pseudomonas sp.]